MLSALVIAGSAGATTICRVTGTGTNGGTGANWGAQSMSLKTALSTSACDEVWVKAGTYTPTTGTNRAASFTISRTVKVFGGFSGNESQRDGRNPVANLTVLSGDLNADDKLDPANNSENSYHVVRVNGSHSNAITASTVLDGFTISGGNASSYADGSDGAGLYCDGSYQGNCSPTISNVIFSGNTATGDGGAIYNDAYTGTSSPTFNNVTFSGNSAGFDRGGAMYNFSYNNGPANPVMTNVILWDNGTCEATDQRGLGRPQGPHCDIGAVEIWVDLIFANGFELAPIT